MTSKDVNSAFSNVDQAMDPAHFVRQMHTVRSTTAEHPYWRPKHDLLQPQAGMRLLDLGCGPGADVKALAELVGSTGLVVGLDQSEVMLAEARQRCAQAGLSVEFRLGDAHHLDWPDGAFDGCHADRVFHHLDAPDQAFKEFVRMAKPGARLVVMEPDFETCVIDSPNHTLTRAILNLGCEVVRNGWMGRHLRALFRDAGLAEVAVEAVPIVFTDYATANQFMWLERTAQRAVDDRLLDAAEVDRWLSELRAADHDGRFFGAVEGFLASGRKP